MLQARARAYYPVYAVILSRVPASNLIFVQRTLLSWSSCWLKDHAGRVFPSNAVDAPTRGIRGDVILFGSFSIYTVPTYGRYPIRASI